MQMQCSGLYRLFMPPTEPEKTGNDVNEKQVGMVVKHRDWVKETQAFQVLKIQTANVGWWSGDKQKPLIFGSVYVKYV